MQQAEITLGESERWLSVIVGGMLALSSLRKRDLGTGLLFAVAGAALLFRGFTGHDGFLKATLGRLRDRIEGGEEA